MSTPQRLWAVMRCYGFESFTVDGVPQKAPIGGPHRYIPVFDTRESAIAFAGSDKDVRELTTGAEKGGEV